MRIFNLFCLILLAAPAAWAEDGREITDLVIRGNRKIESAAIKTKIRSQPGTMLSTSLVQEDIRGIYSLGYFEHVQALEEDKDDGVQLIFEVSEKPVVTKI